MAVDHQHGIVGGVHHQGVLVVFSIPMTMMMMMGMLSEQSVHIELLRMGWVVAVVVVMAGLGFVDGPDGYLNTGFAGSSQVAVMASSHWIL